MEHSLNLLSSHTCLEIDMNAKSAVINGKPFIYLAAAFAMLSGALQAHEVIVRIPVSAAGLDLTQPAGVRELYRRLRVARVDLGAPLGVLGLRTTTAPKSTRDLMWALPCGSLDRRAPR